MILVTGATGTVGGILLRHLISHGEAVRAMTRTPSVLAAHSGLDVVGADFDDPESLAAAVAGVRAVFLLTAPASATPKHDLNLLDAACSAGVTTIVKLSAIGSGERIGGKIVGAWHLEAEAAVRESGMAWTVLRPSSFASNTLAFAEAIKAGDPIPNTTATARQGVIDPRDIAAVAAAALTGPGHGGRVHTLTGPELLSVPDQAAILGSVLGRPVSTVDVSLDSVGQRMSSQGISPAAVETAVTGMTWARAGHNAILTDDVARILGRPATTFRTWVEDHREAFGTE
ncbi:NAD(P)H-binding protein [Saccharomonospora sp. NPDC006951]